MGTAQPDRAQRPAERVTTAQTMTRDLQSVWLRLQNEIGLLCQVERRGLPPAS